MCSRGERLSSKGESYKKNERAMWNQFSRRYTDVVLPEFRPFGRRLIELAGIRPGMWVLDVATGPGEPALTIARRVGPRGLVAGVDFSPTMLRRARARTRALGVRNIQFHEMDAEHLTFVDLTFDRVVCRFGLMIMPDAERALAEMHRVLVPGGRVSVAVWSAQSKVNTLGIVRRSLERHDAFHPPPGAPDFFRFGKAGAMERAQRGHDGGVGFQQSGGVLGLDEEGPVPAAGARDSLAGRPPGRQSRRLALA